MVARPTCISSSLTLITIDAEPKIATATRNVAIAVPAPQVAPRYVATAIRTERENRPASTHHMIGTVSRSRNSMEVTYAPRRQPHRCAVDIMRRALRCDHGAALRTADRRRRKG